MRTIPGIMLCGSDVHSSSATPYQYRATKTKYAKTHQGYWMDRLEKRTYDLSTGEVGVVEEWQVRIQYLGKQEWFLPFLLVIVP